MGAKCGKQRIKKDLELEENSPPIDRHEKPPQKHKKSAEKTSSLKKDKPSKDKDKVDNRLIEEDIVEGRDIKITLESSKINGDISHVEKKDPEKDEILDDSKQHIVKFPDDGSRVQIVCNQTLASAGFFAKDGNYFCGTDYQTLFGTKCHSCEKFVEGNVVSALGNTYHKECFACSTCKRPFPAGSRVTYDGSAVLCQNCLREKTPTPISITHNCASCNEEMKVGQSLLALGKQWHVWCFKCVECSSLLYGEYMGRDGLPYCEKDFNWKFGVLCDGCGNYISGKVLEAGEKRYHPPCARCSRCGFFFKEGEEMYLQGNEIWHPDCNRVIDSQPVNGYTPEEVACDLVWFGGNQSHMTKTGSLPMGSYLDPTIPNQVYGCPKPQTLPRQISAPPNFHRPALEMEPFTYNIPPPHYPKTEMDISQRIRIKKMMSADVIKAARLPSAVIPEEEKPTELKPKIELPEWPAPPYKYFAEKDRKERLRSRLDSETHRQEEEEERKINEEKQKRLEQVERIDSGLGKLIMKEELKTCKEESPSLDPRSASRSPGANIEPPHPIRYESPVSAFTPPKYVYVDGMTGRSATLPAGMFREPGIYEQSTSLPPTSREFSTPQNKTSTLPVSSYHSPPTPNNESILNMKNINDSNMVRPASYHNVNGYQENPVGTSFTLDRNFPFRGSCTLTNSSTQLSKDYLRPPPGMSKGHSLPNVMPLKIYPVHQLLTINKRLPPDVNRTALEQHLSAEDFFAVFHMTMKEFHCLPKWRKDDLKKRAMLF